MTFSEMRYAVDEAKTQLANADRIASELARMLVGRLRHVDATYLLISLKKELRDFNIQSRTWNKA